MARAISQKLHKRAMQTIVGGVNSPVRAFDSVDESPILVDSAKGALLFDVDSNEYVDHLMSWGAAILGHADDDVCRASIEALQRGSSYGLTNIHEIELAEIITGACESIEMLRTVSSGTEAVMSAIRLARGFTGREKIIKFEGCYHGHSDGLLSKSGSGLATLGIPASKGVCKGVCADTLIAKYNDLESVRDFFKVYRGEIAAIIVEPVAGNMGVVLPEDGFLEGLRSICDENNSLLIFDEVITGFRISSGGVQKETHVLADITTLGKIIGGGFPCAAFGASKEIMEILAPLGEVYQAGTLSGNPVAASAGKTVLKKLLKQNPYEKLERATSELVCDIKSFAAAANVDIQVNHIGSMFTVFFTDPPVRDYDSACRADKKKYSELFSHLLNNGVLIPPSSMEACFLSLAHLENNMLEKSRAAFKTAFCAM